MTDKPQQPAIPGPGTDKKFSEKDVLAAQEKARAELISDHVSVQVDIAFGSTGGPYANRPHAIITIRGGDPALVFAFGRDLAEQALKAAASIECVG